MYLLLILYSIINLNVVSWGTREVVAKKTKKELAAEKKEAESAVKQRKKKSLLGFLQGSSGSSDDDEGSIERHTSKTVQFYSPDQRSRR